jgi:4-amino-4-deoxy-L-arabinose transferase-like glycosyltransferase
MPVSRTSKAAALAAPALLAITIAGAVLRLWAFGRVGGNPFYDAAVRSMGLSWHNFFYGAFEPSAQVSIDKAPADLWLQVLSVKIFGFSGVVVRLPEVSAGVLAIPLLYDLVRRLFGRVAGLGAAAALAVLPAAILTAHSDTMDSVMMALDLLAAWLVVVGAQRRDVRLVVAAGAVMGLAFNVKLFEALIVLPACAVLAVLLVDGPARRRALQLAGAAVALVGVALSWIAVASLTPLSRRPWPIGSTNGGVWNVVFGYNGADRLRSSASPAALALDPPGPLRLFSAAGHGSGYAVTVGTTLLAALALGGLALAVAVARRRDGSAAWSREARAGTAFFGVWLVLGVALLSHMQRFQPRYLEAVTPAIAAVLGIGIGALASRPERWARPVLAGSVAAVLAGGVALASAPAWAVAGGLAGVAGTAALAVAARRPAGAVVAASALVAVLAVPAAGAVVTAREHASNAGLPSRLAPQEVARLGAFLGAHRGTATYELASPTVFRAAPIIVRDGRPVLMLTSVAGRPLLTAHRLAGLVAGGHVRYVLLGRGACATAPRGHCAPAVRWALHHSADVSVAAGVAPGTLYGFTGARPRAAGAAAPPTDVSSLEAAAGTGSIRANRAP